MAVEQANIKTIPPLTGLILLTGPTAAGKSTFARRLVDSAEVGVAR